MLSTEETVNQKPLKKEGPQRPTPVYTLENRIIFTPLDLPREKIWPGWSTHSGPALWAQQIEKLKKLRLAENFPISGATECCLLEIDFQVRLSHFLFKNNIL